MPCKVPEDVLVHRIVAMGQSMVQAHDLLPGYLRRISLK